MPTLNIYLVEQRTVAGYDEAVAFVIAAREASVARKMASDQHLHEGADIWLDPKETKVRNLGSGPYREPIVLLRSTRDG